MIAVRITNPWSTNDTGGTLPVAPVMESTTLGISLAGTRAEARSARALADGATMSRAEARAIGARLICLNLSLFPQVNFAPRLL